MPISAHSHILDLFTLAIADGFVAPEELTLIYEKGQQLGLSTAAIDEVIQNPHRVSFRAPESLLEAIPRLYDLACVVVTDDRIDPREVSVLRSYAQRFGIQPELVDQIVAALVDEVRAGTQRDELVAKLAQELA
jgi:uncharacterized membrane protein YebE (DUF533 family)